MRHRAPPAPQLIHATHAPSNRFRVATASLIAATSLLGAVGLWRASTASGDAADAERDGFADLIAEKREETAIRSRLEEALFDELRARAYLAQARGLRRAARRAGAGESAGLLAEAGARTRLAGAVRAGIDRDALAPSGELDLERKLDIELTLARQRRDLDPRPEFARAVDLAHKSEWLVALAAVLIGGAILLTLAEATRTSARTIYLGAGVAVLTAATTGLLLVEVLA
jgi:hypothetical protein